jgi:RND family efflux transporter MFP subunit
MASAAPIYSFSTEEHARAAESAAWARFSAASDAGEFCAGWLGILCAQIEQVNGALLLLGPEADGAYRAAAVWPDPSRDMGYLTPAAERALSERRAVVVARDGVSAPGREQHTFVGYPIEVSGVLHGAIGLEIAPRQEVALQRALRMIYWASAWLIDQFRQQDLKQRDAKLARLVMVTDLLASALQERRFLSTALTVVNELAAHLCCDRVSIGIEESGSVEVQVISHTASFDPKTRMVRLIGEAMAEVLELDTAIVYPAADGDVDVALVHSELAREFSNKAICSVPLCENANVFGAITLERTSGELFSTEEVQVCKTVGMLLGPILALKRTNDRGELQRLQEGVVNGGRALFGPHHPGVKLIATLVCALVLFCAFVNGEYRVPAKTVIEGQIQLAAVAPFDGYVAQSLVRAGDIVSKGQLLARLDERDLKLEQTKLISERDQLMGKHRQAFASLDRAAMAVAAAQINQAEAQLSLIEDKLARASLLAPFAGVVLSGDLSQLLGAPVEQGKVLFQIAPLDSYRVILQVDERDIAHIRVGQQGVLALSGMPDQPASFAVKQITPVSSVEDGRNFFRVEAQLDNPSVRMRPGMEGVGKIAAGDRKLIWIWTHSLVDWLRLWSWKWLT